MDVFIESLYGQGAFPFNGLLEYLTVKKHVVRQYHSSPPYVWHNCFIIRNIAYLIRVNENQVPCFPQSSNDL